MTIIEQRYMDSAINFFRSHSRKHVDWEQRRYEIAREVFAHSQGNYRHDPLYAVRKADLLIEELKKTMSDE